MVLVDMGLKDGRFLGEQKALVHPLDLSTELFVAAPMAQEHLLHGGL